MKQFNCGDIVPGCKAVFRAEGETAILTQVAAHAQKDHGLQSVPPAMVDQVRNHIRDLGAHS